MKIGLFVQWGQRRGGPSAGPRRSFELCWLALLCCVRVCAWGRRPAPCLALPHRVTTHPVASSLHLSHRHRRRRTLAHHYITCRLVVGKWPGRRPSPGVCQAELGPCVLEKYNKKVALFFPEGRGKEAAGVDVAPGPRPALPRPLEPLAWSAPAAGRHYALGLT